MRKAGTPADAVATASEPATTEGVSELPSRTGLPLTPGIRMSAPREDQRQDGLLSLLFQPVVDTDTSQAIRLEASVHRLTLETGTDASRAFVEKPKGYRGDLLAQACLTVKTFPPPARNGALLCLPVTSDDLSEPGLLDDIEKALIAAGMDPRDFEVALSETDVVTAYGKIAAPLKDLQNWGVRLAVHQFAACHASLAYLEKLEVDTIKLDRSIAQRLDKPLRNPHFPLALIRGVLEVAAVLDVTVIADGIETLEQLRRLQSAGCPVQQGALFGPPWSVDQVGTWAITVPTSRFKTSSNLLN